MNNDLLFGARKASTPDPLRKEMLLFEKAKDLQEFEKALRLASLEAFLTLDKTKYKELFYELGLSHCQTQGNYVLDNYQKIEHCAPGTTTEFGYFIAKGISSNFVFTQDKIIKAWTDIIKQRLGVENKELSTFLVQQKHVNRPEFDLGDFYQEAQSENKLHMVEAGCTKTLWSDNVFVAPLILRTAFIAGAKAGLFTEHFATVSLGSSDKLVIHAKDPVCKAKTLPFQKVYLTVGWEAVCCTECFDSLPEELVGFDCLAAFDAQKVIDFVQQNHTQISWKNSPTSFALLMNEAFMQEIISKTHQKMSDPEKAWADIGKAQGQRWSSRTPASKQEISGIVGLSDAHGWKELYEKISGGG